MKSATLPASARAMAHASTGTQTDLACSSTPMLTERRGVVDKVCDRAERLSRRGKLTGQTEDELADQIYGSTVLWLWMIWRYRAVIWQVIRLLAALAHRHREDQGNGTAVSFGEGPMKMDLDRGESPTAIRATAIWALRPLFPGNWL